MSVPPYQKHLTTRVPSGSNEFQLQARRAARMTISSRRLRHMEMLEVRRLPVINKNKRMVGMPALGDVSDLVPSELLSEYVKRVSDHH